MPNNMGDEQPEQCEEIELDEIEIESAVEVPEIETRPQRPPPKWATATTRHIQQQHKQELAANFILSTFAIAGFTFTIYTCCQMWSDQEAIWIMYSLLVAGNLPMVFFVWYTFEISEQVGFLKSALLRSVQVIALTTYSLVIVIFTGSSFYSSEFLRSQLSDENSFFETECILMPSATSCDLFSPQTCTNALSLYNSNISALNNSACHNAGNFTCFLHKSNPCGEEVRLTRSMYAEKVAAIGSLEITSLTALLCVIFGVLVATIFLYNWCSPVVAEAEEDPTLKYVADRRRNILAFTRKQIYLIEVVLLLVSFIATTGFLVLGTMLDTPSVNGDVTKYHCTLGSIVREDSTFCLSNSDSQRTYLVTLNNKTMLVDGTCAASFHNKPETDCYTTQGSSKVLLNFPFPENIMIIIANSMAIFFCLTVAAIILVGLREPKKPTDSAEVHDTEGAS